MSSYIFVLNTVLVSLSHIYFVIHRPDFLPKDNYHNISRVANSYVIEWTIWQQSAVPRRSPPSSPAGGLASGDHLFPFIYTARLCLLVPFYNYVARKRPDCCWPVAYFTKKVNTSLAKSPLKFNGRLSRLGLTSAGHCWVNSYIKVIIIWYYSYARLLMQA